MKCLKINKGNLLHNVRKYRELLDSVSVAKKSEKSIKICAVVKANAYGHSVKNVYNAIHENVDFWAVANVKEAIKFKKISNSNAILILGKVLNYELECAVANKFIISVEDIEQLENIKTLCEKHNCILHIEIVVNSGMNRRGVKKIKIFNDMLKIIRNCKNLNLCGIWTHFFDSTSKENIYLQINVFNVFLKSLTKDERKKIVVHASNSLAFLVCPTATYDMVRIGIGLYGYLPKRIIKLKPALTLTAPILSVLKVKEGEHVGYGSYLAPKNMDIAVIGLGYADGVNRKIARLGHVLINGQKAKIVGNICMDMFMVDITNITVKRVKFATLLGKNGKYNVKVEQWAKWSDTIPYEIITNLNQCRR